MKQIIFLSLIVSLLSSCNDEMIENQTEDKITQTLTDIPQFNSQQDFENSLIEFKNNGTTPNATRNITTLNSSFNLKSTSEELEVNEDSIICSDLFKNFLNERYELIVGEVFFKITAKGTFFTSIQNIDKLYAALDNENILTNATPASYGLGYKSDGDLYELNGLDDIYFFDTFNKKNSFKHPEATSEVSKATSLKSTSYPEDSEWTKVDITGKTGDKLWGFKYERHIHWDKTHRLNIKFYAENYGVYREMGIKTKTQKRGWTGVWRKQNCSAILNGWEILNFKEKWDSFYFGPDFNPNNNLLPTFNAYPDSWKDLNYNTSRYLSKNWKTFNIMGAELDFSRKDKVGAIWHAAKLAGKTSVDYLNSTFRNSNKVKDAIRIVPKSSSAQETSVSLAPYEEIKTSTDKYTMIITSSTGFRVGVTSSGGQFGFSGVESFAGSAEILKSTILYGGALRGTKWKAVKITFK